VIERQKVRPKKLVGYGCLFRIKQVLLQPVHKRLLIIIKYLATPQDGDRFFQQQGCEGFKLKGALAEAQSCF
jgi:hypothetical protein